VVLIARRIGLVPENQDARETEVRERIHGCKAVDALAPALKRKRDQMHFLPDPQNASDPFSRNEP
jgi:hypothetical protein